MADCTPTFTQSTVSDDCLTPPPISKSNLSTVALWASHPFNLSPLTPHPSTSSHPTFPKLNVVESATLASLLHVSARHRHLEASLLPRILALDNTHFVAKRPIIVNWLHDVVRSYHFQNTTLHLAVRYMDCFMSFHRLDQANWQLCATAALFIAAKSEQAGTTVPVVDDLMALCDNAYTPHALRMMELSILSTIKWDLIIKTPAHFLAYFLHILRKRVAPLDPHHFAAGDGPYQPSSPVCSLVHCTHLPPHSQVPPVSVETASAAVSEIEDADDDDDSDTDYMIDDCDYDDESVYSDDDEYPQSLECSEGLSMQDIQNDAFCKPLSTALEDLEHVAFMCLDPCLYDLNFNAQFPPNVLAAAALAVAAETTGEFCLQVPDVFVVTELQESDLVVCRALLKKLFAELETHV